MAKEKGKAVAFKQNEETATKKAKFMDPSAQKFPTLELLRLMPNVTATGIDSNVRKVEGFLYDYTGEVKIVCVCHGRFLSPAQFVEHPTGFNVANPLQHIKVLAPNFKQY
ncbi:hypothetical protein NMG60_11009696 [Bertholletia excelsa]